MKTLIKQMPDKFLAFVVFFLLFLFAIVATNAQQLEKRVVIKGSISMPEPSSGEVYACLAASNGEEMDVMIRPSGKFWINAPEAERYVLQFASDGCITKEVIVDPRHAAKSVGKSKDRVITFDVVLHATDGTEGLRYDGPVGSIRFHHSNGRMKVAHHYQLVAGEQPAIAAGAVE